jgi:Mg-chelatase subunit ChlD
LRDWAKNTFIGVGRGARIATGTSEAVSRGNINWVATILSSVLLGKISDSKIRLRYHSVRRRPRVWCFLDASRSTGMSRCLSAARDSLIDLATYFRSRRWNLLLLRNNQIRWILKQGSYRSFTNVLTRVDSAGGKSYLFQSLHSLHRAILKQGPTAQDRVVIVSDGLASLEAGQRHRDTPSRLRHCLRRITQLTVSTAWLYPSTERALVRWLQKILHGLPVTSIKL